MRIVIWSLPRVVDALVQIERWKTIDAMPAGLLLPDAPWTAMTVCRYLAAFRQAGLALLARIELDTLTELIARFEAGGLWQPGIEAPAPAATAFRSRRDQAAGAAVVHPAPGVAADHLRLDRCCAQMVPPFRVKLTLQRAIIVACA